MTDRLNRFRPVKWLAENTPFTEPQIRWWLFHRESNGLDCAVVRLGRRLYVDVEKFDEWLGESRPGR